MLLDVLQKDIDAGSPNLCTLCPFACALERETGEPWYVSGAHVMPVRELRNPARAAVPLPEDAREWIRRYDAGERMGPITVELPV